MMRVNQATAGAGRADLVRSLRHDLRNRAAVLHGALELARLDGADEDIDTASIANELDRLIAACDEACGIAVTPRTQWLASGENADVARRAKWMQSGSEIIAPASRRILVADDSVDVCTTLGELLRGLGHEVRTAFEGDGALALARSWQPDVVVLDVVMPGMNGFVVARALRAQFSADRMRIVMMSGYALDETTLNNAGEAGFDVCLDKAFTMEDLQSAVDGAGEDHALR